MPEIESIHITIGTGDVSGGGTDGSIYVGVCGREFHLDTTGDDFERGSSREYVVGPGANVNNAPVNDPRKQVLRTEDVESFPVYIRFEPEEDGDNWNLARAELSLNDDFFPRWETASFLTPADGIWLGQRSGHVVHLRKHQDAPPG